MKFGYLKISFYLISVIQGFAQRVLIQCDTTNRINIDSTGYVEIHPHDNSDEAGLFIYAADGRAALRIYGSFRFLSVWDNRKNFHPFDLIQLTIPTGNDDFHYPNSLWAINMSRLGIDAMISSKKLGNMFISVSSESKIIINLLLSIPGSCSFF